MPRVKGGARRMTPEELADQWGAFKKKCDSKFVTTHEFSNKKGEFVSAELRRSVSYTVLGFCVFLGIGRTEYYDKYYKNRTYSDIVTRIDNECEIDVREKFELGVIPPQLSALWMSKFDYRANRPTEADMREQEARIERIKAETERIRAQVDISDDEGGVVVLPEIVADDDSVCVEEDLSGNV